MSATHAAPSVLALVLALAIAGSCQAQRDTRPSASTAEDPGLHQGGGQRAEPCRLRLTPIGDGHLGTLSVGMPIDSLLRVCPSAAATSGADEEGHERTLYAVPVTEQDTVFASVDSVRGRATVRWFSVSFIGPFTDRSLGVGSTFRQVRTQYPHLLADDNEGTVYVWPLPDHGVSFALGVKLEALDARWRQAPSVIPDTARVTELLIRRP